MKGNMYFVIFIYYWMGFDMHYGAFHLLYTVVIWGHPMSIVFPLDFKDKIH